MSIFSNILTESVKYNKLFFLSDKKMNNKILSPRVPNNLGVYSDNEVAIKLYEKFGFKKTKEKEYKDGDKVIFMSLDNKSIKHENYITEMAKSITYSKSFRDVKNIADSLSKKDLREICNGNFNDSPYVIYRNVLLYNGDPAAFIDVYKIDEYDDIDGCIVIACKSKYRGKGFPTQLVNKLKNDKSFKWSHLVWECAKNNVASSTLAKKMGFELSSENDEDYEYSLYRK